jgi:8-oxo-dGTP pyrophosphatase MutT (NUDIX family)
VTVEPRDAATVLLVRDASPTLAATASGIEVFMLRRNARSVFVAGAHVFPGGAVDLEDRAETTYELVDGIVDATASAHLGREHGGLAFWVAAIRETFEEAGVLLARDAATREAVRAEVAATLEHARGPVAAGEQSFARLVADHGLVLDAGSLRLFSHWITPSPAPRRYDTWFFVAPAPSDHAYVHDDDETVASEWLATGDALERSRRGEIDLIYPTFRTLQAIGRFSSCADLFAALDDLWRDNPTSDAAMRVVSGTQASQVRLPGDEADGVEAEADARAHSVTGRKAV